MPRRPSQEKQIRHKRTPLPPSMLDQMEAMMRHPVFLLSLLLWQSMERKGFVNLTEEEARENNAPRTQFRIAAIMEAQDQWLSRSIQDIKRRAEELCAKATQKPSEQAKPTDAMWTEAEAQWAIQAINLPFGDQSDALAPILPADLSSEFCLRFLKESLREYREQTGLKPIQLPRRHGIDPWRVYDLMQEKGATLAMVRDRFCGPYDRVDNRYKKKKSPRSTKVQARVKADLKKVRNAYCYAMKVLDSLKSR